MSDLRHLPAGELRRILALGAIAARAKQAAGADRAPLVFASPEHERFYASEAPEIVASGWMGAGKSRVLCQKVVDLALRYPGAELGLFRKVQASLAATTERTFWQDVLDPRFVRDRNRGEHWVELALPGKPPSRIWLLGLDADPVTGVPSKVGSLNLDYAAVDEAVELSEADWIMLGGRLRRTTMPYRQLAAATNPAAPSHWLKRRFTPPTESREWITIAENRFLTPDFRERLTGFGDGVHAQRLVQGLWVAAEGMIWFLPDDQIREPEQTSWKRVAGGIDWGYVHPFSAEIVAESGTRRRATLDELTARGAVLEDLLPRLLDLQRRYDVSTFYADPSEPAWIAQAARAGLRIEPATNDVLPGIDAVAASIAAGETVSPRCTALLAELPAYTWRRDRGGEQTEQPVSVGDDACDAWRYAHMGLNAGGGWGDFYREETERLRARRAAGD